MEDDHETRTLRVLNVNGHTTLNAPGLVSSPKSKQRRVPLVPGWVTAWEYGMLLAFRSSSLTRRSSFYWPREES